MSTAITSANPFGIFKLKKRNKNSILLLITVLSIGFGAAHRLPTIPNSQVMLIWIWLLKLWDPPFQTKSQG